MCRTSSKRPLDKPSYQPGDTAKLFVKAPFCRRGRDGDRLRPRSWRCARFTLPADGATIEIPVDAGWGSGVYALVSAYRPVRPRPGPQPRGPGRAVGVAWLGIDAAPRTLAVALTAPDVARPRGPVDIAVKVAGARRRRGGLCDARRGR